MNEQSRSDPRFPKTEIDRRLRGLRKELMKCNEVLATIPKRKIPLDYLQAWILVPWLQDEIAAALDGGSVQH